MLNYYMWKQVGQCQDNCKGIRTEFAIFFFKDLLIDWLIDCYVGSSFLC